MSSKFPDICLTVDKNSRKENLNQENDPTGNRTRARYVRGNDVTPRPQKNLFIWEANQNINCHIIFRKKRRVMYKPILVKRHLINGIVV